MRRYGALCCRFVLIDEDDDDEPIEDEDDEIVFAVVPESDFSDVVRFIVADFDDASSRFSYVACEPFIWVYMSFVYI